MTKRLSDEEKARRKAERWACPINVLKRMYKNQVTHSIDRGHPLPEYSRQELIDRYLADPHYLSLHSAWLAAGMPRNLIPSMDRKDHNRGYSFDNCEMVTWEENYNRSKPHNHFKPKELCDAKSQ